MIGVPTSLPVSASASSVSAARSRVAGLVVERVGQVGRQAGLGQDRLEESRVPW